MGHVCVGMRNQKSIAFLYSFIKNTFPHNHEKLDFFFFFALFLMVICLHLAMKKVFDDKINPAFDFSFCERKCNFLEIVVKEA